VETIQSVFLEYDPDRSVGKFSAKPLVFLQFFLYPEMYSFNAVHRNREIGSINVTCLHYVTIICMCLNSSGSVYYMIVFKLMGSLLFPLTAFVCKEHNTFLS